MFQSSMLASQTSMGLTRLYWQGSGGLTGGGGGLAAFWISAEIKDCLFWKNEAPYSVRCTPFVDALAHFAGAARNTSSVMCARL